MPHDQTDDHLPELADIHKLAIHPLDPTRLYATTHYGTFRSDDGSETWGRDQRRPAVPDDSAAGAAPT